MQEASIKASSTQPIVTGDGGVSIMHGVWLFPQLGQQIQSEMDEVNPSAG